MTTTRNPKTPAALAAMSLPQLVEYHNRFCGVLPGLKPLKAGSVKAKSDLIVRLSQLGALRPSHVARLQKITPFAAREALRAAASGGVISHQANKPWHVSPIDYAAVFLATGEKPAARAA